MKKEIDITNPVIFFGTGRSGTTLISNILMRHHDLGYPSNYHQRMPKNKYINYCRIFFESKLFQQIHRWSGKSNVTKKLLFKPTEAYRMWDYITGDNVEFSKDFMLGVKANLDQKVFIQNYFTEMVSIQGKKRLAIKITGPSRLEYLLSIFPNAQFINIVRKPVPVISSFLKVEFWKNSNQEEIWWDNGYSEAEKKWIKEHTKDEVLMTAFQLNKVLQTTKQELAQIQPNYITVTYEDFLDNPQNESEKMLDFLNLDPSKNITEYLEAKKIYNRQKDDKDYFPEEKLKEIYQVFNL